MQWNSMEAMENRGMCCIFLRQEDIKTFPRYFLCVTDKYLYVYVQKKSLKGYAQRFNIISSLQGYTKIFLFSLEGKI